MRIDCVFAGMTGAVFIPEINCPCKRLSWELGMLQWTFFLRWSVGNHIPAAMLNRTNEE